MFNAMNIAITSFIAAIFATAIFLIGANDHYQKSIHLLTISGFIVTAVLIFLSQEVLALFAGLIPLLIASIFYKPRPVIYVSILTLALLNGYALAYLPVVLVDTGQLIAVNILLITLMVFILVSAFHKQSGEDTVRKQTQDLAASEERFRQIVTASPNFLAIYHPEQHRIQSWNMESYLGYATRDIADISVWRSFVHPESLDIVSEISADLRNPSDLKRNYDLRIYNKERTATHWISFQISTLQHGDSSGVALRLITMNDITANKEMEQDRLRHQLEQQKEDMLSTVIRSFSHEFRTPLSLIETNLYLLGRKVEEQGVDIHIKGIRHQVNRITKLTEQLNLLIRLKNKPELTLSRTAINSLLADIGDKHQPAIEKAGIQLVRDFAEGQGNSLIDAALMTHLFDNVIDNAIKFTPPEGTITLSTIQVNNMLRVRVSDTGQGISGEVLDGIYRMFEPADASHTRKGLGLGLSIVKAIADAHKFELSISSEEDCCTTIEITIPLLNAQELSTS